jgi:glycosyltransferase involved in cell wall biosynthesis
MPTVIIEAMAAGIPVIATATMGARALIQPGIDGWLVPVDDASALCEAILNAHTLPEKRRALALQAKQSVLRYSIDKTARCQLALYRRLLRLPDNV